MTLETDPGRVPRATNSAEPEPEPGPMPEAGPERKAEPEAGPEAERRSRTEPTAENGAPARPAATPEPQPPAGGAAAPVYRWLRAVLRWPTGSFSAGTPLDTLLRTHRGGYPVPDPALLQHAFAVADRLHEGQVRRSGEKYISHPLAVAQILAELGMDPTTLAAALLHDTVEDTDYTPEQLRADFGAEVALLVDGVTKLDKMFFGDAAEAETVRKMIVAAGQDVRVLIIKLADRLHNMRTLQHKSRTSQVRIARATQDVLVPMADRLGIHVLKRELEDLVLRTLDPDIFLEIDKYLGSHADTTEHLPEVIGRVGRRLRRYRVNAEIVPRPRHHWSVYREMTADEPREPDDPPRIVVIVNGPATDCYAALGAVHGLWRPVPGRFKDFIASPKFNLYQSLHTTVMGPENQPLEVMIRTELMNDMAEYGIIVSLRGEARSGEAPADGSRPDWLQALLAWQGDAIAPAEFLDSLRCDLSEDQVQVFTTTGDRVVLPGGGTVVDLAYTLDTRKGDRLIGAYVNGRLVPLTGALEDGDVVEIITAPDGDFPGPSRDWLDAAKSASARLGIAKWFGEAPENDPAAPPTPAEGEAAPTALAERIEAGRVAVARALRRYERSLAVDDPLLAVAREMGFPDLDALFVAVSAGSPAADDVVSRLIASVDHPDNAGGR